MCVCVQVHARQSGKNAFERRRGELVRYHGV